MTDRLAIYNGALLMLGEQRLGSLTEDREPRYALDLVWNDGGVAACLSEGQWKFAMRTALMTYNPAIEPPFGYRRGFDKPDDWVTTSSVCSDEFFNTPLLRYSDEAGVWYADLDDIYVRYISNDASYGMDLGNWPSSFAEYVKGYFALRTVRAISSDAERWKEVMVEMERRKITAKNRDAQADPTRFAAESGWQRARRGGRRRGPFGDGGTTGSLTG